MFAAVRLNIKQGKMKVKGLKVLGDADSLSSVLGKTSSRKRPLARAWFEHEILGGSPCRYRVTKQHGRQRVTSQHHPLGATITNGSHCM
jgi:hypothetical protein